MTADDTERAARRYPALGPAVWSVLLRNEWFKARHRLAFIVSLALFAFVHVMEYGDNVLRARRDEDYTFALPDAWSAIFGDESVILLIFASIAVVMLASSEFSWRTARQNVIDGLSKTQWFWGKVIMLGIVAVAFLSTKLLIGGGGAALGTDFGSAARPAVPWSAVAATGALLLAFLNVGGLALLCATTIRSSGPAMAVWFFWITLGEQLVPSLLVRVLPSAQPMLGMLPFNASQQILDFWRFDQPTFQRMVERAQAAGETVPELPNMVFWLGLNAGWAILFVTVAYALFRRRDL
jgi:ABC-type transport system involved in multi-copper enzyme maturation permease subunit